MKTLVIYTSQTGFTKKYCNWLSEEMSADILDIKDAKKKNEAYFADYDAIVYGGWVMAGSVVKSKWFFKKAEKWNDKRLAMICVGGSPNGIPEVDKLLGSVLNDSQRKYIKAFYCQGGFDYEKMNWFSRTTLKMFTNALKKKEDEETQKMVKLISKSCDISDKKYLEPVIEYLKN